MKVISFKIPRPVHESIRVQQDDRPYLYNHLHQHPEIQLTLIEASKGTLIAGDYVGRFEEGDLFVIGSNQPHVFRNDPVYFRKQKKAKALTVFFDETTLGQSFWQLPECKNAMTFLKNSAGGFQINGKKKQRIIACMYAIVAAEGLQKIVLFIQILSLLSTKKEQPPLSQQHLQKPIKNKDGARLNSILEYTFKESDKEIRLHEIAAIAHLTPEAFCKYFKKRTGKTYTDFLNEIRVNNVCRLLMASPEQPIAVISMKAGFNNLSYFNRVFKRIKGITPGDYRDQISSPSRS